MLQRLVMWRPDPRSFDDGSGPRVITAFLELFCVANQGVESQLSPPFHLGLRPASVEGVAEVADQSIVGAEVIADPSATKRSQTASAQGSKVDSDLLAEFDRFVGDTQYATLGVTEPPECRSEIAECSILRAFRPQRSGDCESRHGVAA